MTQLTNLLYLLFSLNGRLSRAGYFFGLMCIIAISFCLIFLPNQFAPASITNSTAKIWVLLITFMNLIASIACLMIAIGIHVKRFHDLGLTGWLTLFFFTPFNPLVLIVCLFFPGKIESNKYGAPPIG